MSFENGHRNTKIYHNYWKENTIILFNSTQNIRIWLCLSSLTHFQLYTNYTLTIH